MSRIKSLPNEKWEEIDGYDGYYEISNMGRVMSHYGKGRILKVNKFAIVGLSLYGDTTSTTIWLLVWDYFGSKKRNPHYLDVTHINGIITDNKIENLELIGCHEKPVKWLKYKNTSSKYIGVRKVKNRKVFRSSIKLNEKSIELGSFSIGIDASNAYQKALSEILEYKKVTKPNNIVELLQGEEWKCINGYNGHYEVSNMGRVKSRYKGERLMKSNGAFPRVVLYLNNVQKNHGVSTLVWDYFGDKKRIRYKTEIFHINGNLSDNRISNLQLLYHRELMSNAYKKKNTLSKYTGVTWSKKMRCWCGYIFVNGKLENLGVFKKEIKAHEAYQSRLAEIQAPTQ